MQRKDDAEYYLHRDFNGEYASAGCLFLEKNCDAEKPSDNLIIYGHHMKNGNMFGKLQNYEDEKFYRAHKAIVFDTVREHREYQVLSVFRGQAYAADDTEHFHYYDFTEARDQEDFEDYVEQITRRSQYQTGVTAEYGDELLTLSTCAYHKEEGRFVEKKRDNPKRGCPAFCRCRRLRRDFCGSLRTVPASYCRCCPAHAR